MRSRYTAYTVHAIDYIIKTSLDENERIDYKETKDWSENSKWLGLKIVSTNRGSITDTEGTVEFEASFEKDGLKEIHHETARFSKKGEKWMYKDGETVPKTVIRTGPKIGRNDPCPCGSGRKYKHCCGAG
jgi:SEC-C motif-containing protein